MQNGHLSDVDTPTEPNTVVEATIDDSKLQNGVVEEHTEPPLDAPPLDTTETPQTNGIAASPRGKKRKLTDLDGLQRSRKLSPPWKKIEAEGPTSFVEGGRRKSSRVNAVPLELQPQAGVRQTRAALTKSAEKKQRPSMSTSKPSGRALNSQTRPLNQPQAPKSNLHSTAKPLHAKRYGTAQKSLPKQPSSRPQSSSNALMDSSKSVSSIQTRHHRKPSAKSLESMETSPVRKYKPRQSRADTSTSRPTSPINTRVRSLKLLFRPKHLEIVNPLNVPSKKKHESLADWAAHDNPLEGDEDRVLTTAEILKEARVRVRLEKAAEPGGKLYDYSPEGPGPEPSEEPPQPYCHQDYLLKHIQNFVPLLKGERRFHLQNAKKLAVAAVAKWKERQPKSVEERLEEQRKTANANYKRVLKQIEFGWNAMENAIKQEKLKQWEQNQEAMGQKTLHDMLEHSTQLLLKRTARASEGLEDEAAEDQGTDEDDEGTEISDDDESDGDEEDDEDDDDMSSSSGSSKSLEENVDGVPDDQLTREELIQKYANLQDLDNDTMQSEDIKEEGQLADDSILDDTSDDYGSDDEEDSDMEEDDEGEEASDEEDEEQGLMSSLMGFYGKAELESVQEASMKIKQEADEADELNTPASISGQVNGTSIPPETDGEDTEMHDTEAENVAEAPSASEEPSRQMSPNTEPTLRQSSASSVEPEVSDRELPVAVKTEVPFLLRGDLREYQHYGLDWLAGMYANNTNGILADEMGLGKTIQTIALLAHLATVHEKWGPHLIVVPTSVMLNWEMEFKKWCPGFKILTYYGTQEERRMKRKGWMDNDRWNVCITSYQLALQDASSLKRKRWYYMVLDEAHNIKNFRSQRWQTLLNFSTERRLLLTGTPLQNNLTELWSLLFFLSQDETKFGDLAQFTRALKGPAEQILDHGREAMDPQAREIVKKLHRVLRPHLLRRLKADVEKQMPKKYEHVMRCRLSKRQRQLYDGYMGLAGTRQSFSSGNYMSIINCLMQLRKVCNHPNLFETRQIVTSFAMPRSAVADFEIQELLVRRRLLAKEDEDKIVDMMNLWQPNNNTHTVLRTEYLSALRPLSNAMHEQGLRINPQAFDARTMKSAMASLDSFSKYSRYEQLRSQISLTALRTRRRPALSSSLLDRIDFRLDVYPLKPKPSRRKALTEWHLNHSTVLQDMVLSLGQRAEGMNPYISRFGCITPAVTAPNMAQHALTSSGVELVKRAQQQSSTDAFHESRVRLSIAFPDKSLIQYDCGKLQQLDRLLRQLQAGGHRALIFTQMTKVLDILEQFLNLHGHLYLRLDGATKIEQRQILTDRFNNDPRILAFILSSRSGGLGINLTGADTVIFYDLDWNPAMDKQCQDRCHRIGQTRDVHIYRFVSEGTIEANILRKSNQKRMLDDVVIQEGDFTTDYFNRMDYRDFLPDGGDGDKEADAALDRILGGSDDMGKRELEQVEDQEDREAAKVAEKEIVQTDDADFSEKAPGTSSAGGAGTPKPDAPATPAAAAPSPAQQDTTMQDAPEQPNTQVQTPAEGQGTESATPAADEEQGDVEDYMKRFMRWLYREITVVPASEKARKKAKKGQTRPGERIRR